MTISIRQASPITVVSAGATTVSCTLPAAPVAGNKLAFLLLVDKTAGTFTPPTGFAARQTYSNTSISALIAEKTADGSESGAISASWTGSFRPKAILVELQGSAGAVSYDSSQLSGTETNVTTISTGSVTVGATAGFALVLFGNDSAKAAPTDPDPVPTLTGTNGTFSVYTQNWFATGGIGEPGFVLGSGTVTPSSSVSCSVSLASATADQMVGAIIVFAEDGGGGGGSSGRGALIANRRNMRVFS